MTEEQFLKYIPLVGASFFGAVVGWLAHNVFQRAELLNVSWLASMLGIIAGGAVTAIFQKETLFGAYCIGLGIAFFSRVIIFPITKVIKKEMELQELKETQRQQIKQDKIQKELEAKRTS
jgi:Na+/phosphate symporter